ncbi:NnrS family protein [Pseudoalteromonas sp. SCSIO 43201]|uniref:NnrS family protein n=1 Tax=Pseudoalteromonas sp. SCSIO 43201 TaxID=2822842 RepID=UPI002074D457|nr:NnrS family protein [Pseudoalteromonas sp. SCSIO 43201]USD30941.1 NnrS family protein [Pseudoalteromonas sp. SCSIO 43201]
MPLLQPQDPTAIQFRWHKLTTWPLLMLGFRPLFMLAGLSAVLSISVWIFILNGQLEWHHKYPAIYWHAHEMLFGFAGAVVAGFLLTAAQNWTQKATLNGAALLSLCGIWLAARLSFFIPQSSVTLTLLLQATFWLLLLTNLSSVIITARSKNNRVFIFYVGVIGCCNIAFLTALNNGDFLQVGLLSQSSLIAYMLLIGVVSGRVIPFFIARGLQKDQKPAIRKVDRAIFYLAILCVCISPLQSSFLHAHYLNGCLLILGCLHLVRAVYWFDIRLVKVPLLWSLYVSYFAIAAGLLLCAYNRIYHLAFWRDHLHLVAISGMSLMILSMMARVTLGHTGRSLTTHLSTTIAFTCIVAAGISRAFLIHFTSPHNAWLISALMWVFGFFLFLITFSPMLLKQRLDGRQG